MRAYIGISCRDVAENIISVANIVPFFWSFICSEFCNFY